MVWNRLILPTAIGTWLTYSIAWLSSDHTLRDGDADGHVGTAELFREVLKEEGIMAYLQAIWLGDYGDYPNLFGGLLGGWWALIGGQPEDILFRIFPLFSLLITAHALWVFLKPNRTHAHWGVILVLLLPMANGICRHSMPEGLVMALLTLTLACGMLLLEQITWKRLFSLGILMGFGALSKHNFIVLGLLPLGWFLWRLGRKSLFPIAIASIIAGPWYIGVGLSKQAYVQSTMSSSQLNWASLFAHISGFLWDGLGPILALIFCLSLKGIAFKSDRNRLLLCWLVGGLMVLTLLPKQYPRLLLPILPAALCWIAPWIAERKRAEQLILVALMGFWLHGGTIVQYPVSPLYRIGDSGCAQHWLHPPKQADFGMAALTEEILSTAPRGVWLARDLDIPCTIQTTHSAGYHLEYRLRRHGYGGAFSNEAPLDNAGWLKVSWDVDAHQSWQPQVERLERPD